MISSNPSAFYVDLGAPASTKHNFEKPEGGFQGSPKGRDDDDHVFATWIVLNGCYRHQPSSIVLTMALYAHSVTISNGTFLVAKLSFLLFQTARIIEFEQNLCVSNFFIIEFSS